MSSPAVTYARQNHPRFLSELKDLLRIPSVSTLPEHNGDCRKAAEVLAADAFSAFKESGVFNPQTARRFVDSILSRGGSRDALEAFIEFRGRAPDIRPLLELHGIAA